MRNQSRWNRIATEEQWGLLCLCVLAICSWAWAWCVLSAPTDTPLQWLSVADSFFVKGRVQVVHLSLSAGALSGLDLCACATVSGRVLMCHSPVVSTRLFPGVTWYLALTVFLPLFCIAPWTLMGGFHGDFPFRTECPESLTPCILLSCGSLLAVISYWHIVTEEFTVCSFILYIICC